MKRILFISALIITFGAVLSYAQQSGERTVASPDGRIELSVQTSDRLTYSISFDGNLILEPSPVSLTVVERSRRARNNVPIMLGNDIAAKPSFSESSVHNAVTAFLHHNRIVTEKYNSLTVNFSRSRFSVEFRVYDEGVAYRFMTFFKDSIDVLAEEAVFNFPADMKAWIPYSPNRRNPFQNSFESQYTVSQLSGFDSTRLSITPMLLETAEGVNILLTESDLYSYPGLFLGKGNGNTLKGAFAPIPSETETDGVRHQEKVVSYSDVLAKTEGSRAFPWRVIAVAEDETELPTLDLPYLLGEESRIEDTSWIVPGKAAWEWWNDWGITGVDFRTGINTDTYKYMIDFAAANGLEYLVVDEGWSPPTGGDIMAVVPELDLEEVAEYAREKNVGLILWAVAYVLDRDLEEACSTYSAMGIKGFKVDFMDRDDQPVVDMLYRILDVAARYGMIIDYHGMYKPTGLHRTYPNLLNYEGVVGLENVKWSNDDLITYDVTFPYIRMAAGPVDYTPGAMRNAQPHCYSPNNHRPMSKGTRARQVALYVAYDSPLTMLCDSPTAYMKEQETTDFITSLPTLFGQTRVIGGEIGKFFVNARLENGKWYIGGVNGRKPMTFTFTPDFLEPHEAGYRMTLFRDGVNADRYGEDYILETVDYTFGEPISVDMAAGGGFCIIIENK